MKFKSISLKKATIINFAIILLFVPIIIFIIGWTKLIVSLPTSALICFLLFTVFKKIKANLKEESISIPIIWLLACAGICLVQILLTGIGGVFPQSGDHIGRNPIFYDIINEEWPVYYQNTNSALTYYIGFWMIPALAGKLFLPLGDVLAWDVGNIVLIIQSTLFWFLAILLTYIYISPKVKHKYAKQIICAIPIVLILFAGLSELGAMLTALNNNSFFWGSGANKDWYSFVGAYSGIFTAIAYTFNSMLPSILVATLLLICRNFGKSFYVIFILGLLLYAPLPLVGLVFIIVSLGVFDLFLGYKQDKFKGVLVVTKTYLSFVNISCLLPILILYLFYSGNSYMHITFTNIFLDVQSFVGYLIFCMCEFGIVAIILFKSKKRDPVFIISIILLAGLLLFRLESAGDWSLRVSTFGIIFLGIFLTELICIADIKKIFLLFCAVSYISICSMDVFADNMLMLSKTTPDRVYHEVWTLKTLNQHRNTSNYYYAGQYNKLLPQDDFFFSKLCPPIETTTPDILVKYNNVEKVLYSNGDIDYLKQVINGDLPLLANDDDFAIYDVKNNEIQLKNDGYLIPQDSKVSIDVENFDEFVDYLNGLTDITNQKLPGQDSFFLEVVFKNESQNIFVSSDIESNNCIGLSWETTNTDSESIDTTVSEFMKFEFNLLPDDEIMLYIPILIFPKEYGEYTFSIDFYQQNNFSDISLFRQNFEITTKEIGD